MDYDDDLELTRYVWDHYPALMTAFERRVGQAILGRLKAAHAGAPPSHPLWTRWGAAGDPAVEAALADGPEAYRRRVRIRVLAEADEALVNRCPTCGRVVRTPAARQCLWCGHDWHRSDPVIGGSWAGRGPWRGEAGMTLFETWSHNWFGLWKAAESDPFEVPVFSDVVDVTWRPHDLDRLVGYLRACPVALASSAKPEKCPHCEVMLTELSVQRSDGVWVWPSSLSHYVAAHQVRLPDRMVTRIRERGYRVPSLAGPPG